MKKHTLGPLKFDENTGDVSDTKGHLIHRPYEAPGVSDEQMDAYGRLFSAAPELLKACKTLATELERQPAVAWMSNSAWQQVRAAIDKAEGAS